MATLVHPKPSPHTTTLDRVCDMMQDVAFVLVVVSGVAAVVTMLVLLFAL